MTNYFYDSYAIIEFINGNPLYREYFLEEQGVTTLYNVMEVYYVTLCEEGEEKAKIVLKQLASITIYPSLEDVADAMKFRLTHKQKNLSYADCLGYIMSLRRKLIFLTGDKEFKDFPHVRFVTTAIK